MSRFTRLFCFSWVEADFFYGKCNQVKYYFDLRATDRQNASRAFSTFAIAVEMNNYTATLQCYDFYSRCF